jgi:peptide/nickel transport system substrate-binding protein
MSRSDSSTSSSDRARLRRSRAAALLIAGCCLHGPCPAGTPQVLVVAQSLDDIVSLDPAEGYELSSMQAFTSLYQRLVQPDPDHPESIRGAGLAAAWRAEPGSLVFELRPDAVFANGDSVRPEDVIWSLSRAVKLNLSPAFILNGLGWTPATVDEHLQKVDEHHVRITWSAPVGPSFALNVLGATVASIVDQRDAESHAKAGDLGNRWLHDHSAGSGPFRIRRYIPHEALVLDANPLSPGDAPRLKTIVIRNVPDAATRELLVRVGDADIARGLGPDQYAALRDRPGLQLRQFPSATVHYLLFNTVNPGVPQLANPALWQAARWLIDYEGIAHQLLRDQYQVHQAFLATGFPGALDDTPYRLDIPRARSILHAAGLDHGLTITLDVFNQAPFTEIAQSLQATFAAAGIRLQIQPALTGEVYTRVRSHSVQAVWLYWIPDYFDAHSSASAFALNLDDGSTSIAERAGWRIPQLSALTLAAVREQDVGRRLELYRQIQTEVQRSSPFVIALQERSELVMRANVRGYRQGLNADMVYYDQVTK